MQNENTYKLQFPWMVIKVIKLVTEAYPDFSGSQLSNMISTAFSVNQEKDY